MAAGATGTSGATSGDSSEEPALQCPPDPEDTQPLTATTPWPEVTGSVARLREYVQDVDPEYSYALDSESSGVGYTLYNIQMDSLRWRPEGEITPGVWNHWMTIIVPEEITTSKAHLVIVGGSVSAELPVMAEVALLVQVARDTGSPVVVLGQIPAQPTTAPDRPEPLTDALARGLAADVLVTSGGISVGVHDLVLAGLTALGLSLRVRKVALRPGRPLTFGIAQGTPVFALPGNPASTLVAFELFVRPALAKLSGLPRARWFRPEVTATLTAPAPATFGRDEYLRARVEGSLGGPFLATPLTIQVSGALRSISGHNALLVRPARSPAAAAGAPARALLLELPDPPGQ